MTGPGVRIHLQQSSIFEGDEHLGGSVAPSLGQWCTFPEDERSEGPLSDFSPGTARLVFTHSLITPQPGTIETRGFRGKVAQRWGKTVLTAVNLYSCRWTAGREVSK